MHRWIAVPGLTIAAASHAVTPLPPIPEGIYSNEEQVYFEKEAGRRPPPSLILVNDGPTLRAVDAFGTGVPLPKASWKSDGVSVTATLMDGTRLDLRRARPVTCWASIRKAAPKADGADDWTFIKDIKLHDQGGRALIGKDVAGVKPLVLRMRNVTWSGSARASNRPSLVLYVHAPDEPDKAVSYVWSDPGAARLGINLRWMQASCTVDGMEKI